MHTYIYVRVCIHAYVYVSSSLCTSSTPICRNLATSMHPRDYREVVVMTWEGASGSEKEPYAGVALYPARPLVLLSFLGPASPVAIPAILEVATPMSFSFRPLPSIFQRTCILLA